MATIWCGRCSAARISGKASPLLSGKEHHNGRGDNLTTSWPALCRASTPWQQGEAWMAGQKGVHARLRRAVPGHDELEELGCMAVIDCHHHVWWLDKFPHTFPPSWGTSLNRDFTPDDLRPELKAAGIDGTILVQSLDKYEETLHYLDVADRTDFIRAVIGWLPLADPPACAKALEALKPRRNFAGMRHLIVYEKDPKWLLWPRVQEGLELLRKAGLVFEAITNTEEQMATVLETARRMPDLNIVLNHLGRPPLPEQGWEPWASQMVRAAAFPNI